MFIGDFPDSCLGTTLHCKDNEFSFVIWFRVVLDTDEPTNVTIFGNMGDKASSTGVTLEVGSLYYHH